MASDMLAPKCSQVFNSHSIVYVGWMSLIAKFIGPTWGPSGADRPQVGPMLAPSILLHAVHSTTSWTVLKAFGRAQFSPLQLADKSPMITDQHTAGGSVSQLSQLAKLSPWLTLSTKDITTSFWHYKKWFCFLSNQIKGLYHFSNPTE